MERLDLEIIATGKRTRLTFREMNELTVQDVLDYARVYSGAEDDSPKQATQSDIDKFLA